MAFSQSPLDPYLDTIRRWVGEGIGPTEIALKFKQQLGINTSDRSVRRAIEKNNITVHSKLASQPGLEIQGDDATLTSSPGQNLADFDELIRSRGLDPEEWSVVLVSTNEWDSNAGDGQVVKLQQMKVSLRRKAQSLSFIEPANPIKTFSRPPKNTKLGDSILAVVLGDEQEPYSDPYVEASTLMLLEEMQPDVIVHLGDLMDFPTISRHKDNPEWSATAQECINAGYLRLRSYREAAPNARFMFMVGNHDERLRNELLLRAERMYNIRPADVPGEPEAIPAYSPRHLLRLDELAIEFIDPHGGYAHAQVNLSDQLGVRHGWLTGENTAGKTLDRLGHSIIVGHTHSQRITQKTVYSLEGQPKVLTAVEAGTQSRVKDGLGYAVNPNWQQGCVTAQIWEDGTFHLDLATYTDRALRWRDKRYSNPKQFSTKKDVIETVLSNELMTV